MDKKIFIDKIVDFCSKCKLLKPLCDIYYKYRQIWLYLFFGVLTTVVNIVVYEIVVNIFNIDYLLSNVIAWIISIIFAYITNKNYVFDSNSGSNNSKQFISFVSARLFSLLIDMMVMYIGVTIICLNDTFIKIMANVIVIVLNYFLSKFIIFKKKQ